MKKVLSLVLVLTLVLGSFSMAFAAETSGTGLSDVAGDPNEGAIEVAFDLDIISGYPDGTFKPDNNVTRAEFAKMMTKALAIPESALTGFKTSTFTDVKSSDWFVSYIGYCVSKGIMKGYGNGTVQPNGIISVNEAITMVCRAIGYTDNAQQLVGTWPANYIALGQQLGLYDDVDAITTTDRASAAQMIYNALTQDLVYIDNDGTTQTVSAGTNALGGIIPATMLRSLGGGAVNDGDGFVLTENLAKNAVINLTDYVGSFVTAYADKKGAGDIIAVEVLSTKVKGTFDGKTFTTTDDQELIFSNSDFGYTWTNNVGGATTPFSIGNGNPLIFANGYSNGTTSTGGIKADDETTYTMNVNLSGKTIKEVYSVETWTADALDLYSDGDLDLKNGTISVDGTKYDFPTDKNGAVDYSKFSLLGVSSVEKIAEDNVIQVYTDGTNNTIKRLAVGTKTIEGKCSKITLDSAGAPDEYIVDGTGYAAAALNKSLPAVGQTGTAWLTYGGDIAKWKETEANAGNYAVYLGTASTTKFGETTVSVKLFTKEGKTVEYDVTSTSAFQNPAGAPATVAAIGDIVKFGLNSSGKVNSMVIHTDKKVGTPTLNTPKTLIDGIGKLSSNVLVFMKDGSDWSLGDIKSIDVDYDGWNFIAQKDNDSSEDIVAVVVNKQQALGYDEKYGLITAIADAENSDGDTQMQITYFVDGVEKTGFVDTTAQANALLSGTNGANCLYEIKVDSEGVVTKITTNAVELVGAGCSYGGFVVTEYDKTNKVVTATGGSVSKSFTLSSDVVVYVYDKKGNYKVGDLTVIGKNKTINVYRTSKTAKDDKAFNIVIISEERAN